MPKNKSADLSLMFKLEPKEAVAYLENKGFKITSDWRDLWEDAHAKAFTVSKMTDIELLKDTKNTLNKALKEGWSCKKTQSELTNMYKTRGWWGKQEITDKDGNVKTIQLGSPHRVRTIYNQNMQSAYNAGRYLKQLQNVDFAPYFQYICVLDERTRPEHRAMHNKIFRYDDPLWASLYPPNGWGCRCTVRQLTSAEVQKNNSHIEKSDKYLSYKDVVINEDTGETKKVAVFKTKDLSGKVLSMQTDAGWSTNVGKASWDIDVLAYNSVKDMPQKLKDNFISEMAQNIHTHKAYSNFVKNTIKNGLKAKGIEQTLTWIKPDIINNITKENLKINTPVIVLQDNRIGHIIGNVKTDKQKITDEQLMNLYNIVNSPDEIYLNSDDKTIFYIRYLKEDEILDNRDCIKVVVKISRFKKDKPVNYIATAGRIKKQDLKNPAYKKIE